MWLDDSTDNQELNFDGFIVSHKEKTINGLNTRGGEVITLILDYYKYFDYL